MKNFQAERCVKWIWQRVASLLLIIISASSQSALPEPAAQPQQAPSDPVYDVFSGDVNGDRFPDLLLRARSQFAIADYQLQPLTSQGWRETFVVLSDSQGRYMAQSRPPASVLSSSVWQSGTHELAVGDTNGDGRSELLLRALTERNVSVLVTRSAVDETPVVLQRLMTADLDGADLGQSGLTVDLQDTNDDGDADLLTSHGIVVQSIFLADSDGRFSSGSSPRAGSDQSQAANRTAATSDPSATRTTGSSSPGAATSSPAIPVMGAGSNARQANASPASAAIATPSSAPNSAAPQSVSSSSAVVAATQAGATRGRFSVSAIGAATYDIPLWMPRGPGGVQPQLSLHYDSGSSLGIMGPGWSIGGLGAIYRCNKTYAQDGTPAAVALATTDGYCLDGKRLRLTSGTTGVAGSTYETEIADFSNVTAYGSSGNGPAYFYVQRKDGLIYEYGSYGGAQIKASGSSTPYQWRLSIVRDRYGNQYIITYGTGQKGSAGIGVPQSISYAATSFGTTTFRYNVLFSYLSDNSDGTEVAYIAGGSTINNNLLSRIEIQRLDTGKSLRTYSLGYVASPTTNRNRLSSVQECSDSALTSCLSPTIIGYQDGSTGVAATSNTAFTSASSIKGVYDFNGDGRQDFLYQSGNTLYVTFATAGGYTSALNTGITLMSNDAYDAGDLIASGKDDIFVTRSGVWYRYYWNGSSFIGVSTGFSRAADDGQPTLADINGDGLPDLLTFSLSAQSSVFTRLNTSVNGSLSFSPTRNIGFSFSCGNCIAEQITVKTSRGLARDILDFNGDGRNDLYIATANNRGANVYVLKSDGATFSSFDSFSASDRFANFINWNDDACTDLVTATYIKISSCAGVASQTLPYSGTRIGVMDWNGDGHADLLLNSGGYIGVRLSTGGGLGALTTTSIPAPSTLTIFDQNGDGLDDIGEQNSASPSSVTYRLHNGAGTPPDLIASITDGYGVAAIPVLRSLVQGTYTKGTGAILPERDVQIPLYVVTQTQTTDGIGGFYTKFFSYAGAREDIQGRGFSGFQGVVTSDNRSGSTVSKSLYRTAFPYSGLLSQQDVFQNDGVSPIDHRVLTPAVMTLSSAASQQRYFPYIASISDDAYEVGGIKNGQLFRQTGVNFTFDNYGNVTSSTTTLYDRDNAPPQSPAYNQSWTTTVTNKIYNDTKNWCLGIPTYTTVERSATNVPSVKRTVNFTASYGVCRVTQQVVEPSSTLYKVTTEYGYDVFGNINTQTVTGINLAARTTSTNWGPSGQFPESVTDPLGQISSATYDYDTDFLASATDPNKLTNMRLADAFGRVAAEMRPDSTSTIFTYQRCSNAPGGCQNGDPNGNSGINKTVVTTTVKDAGGAAIRDDLVYLDQFDRPIVAKSKTLTGGYSRIGIQYDAHGRLYRQTAPCDAASCAVYWTTNSYDPIDRLIQQMRPVSASDSNMETTSFSYQGLTTVTTDALGKSTTKVVDPNGWLRRSKDHDGYYQAFTYDAFGSMKSITDSQSNNLLSASYDYGLTAFRRQTIDMDTGTWNYSPNALGEVTNYSDANGNNFTLTYDKLSRPLTRFVSGEGTTTWTWGSSAGKYNIGRLVDISSTSGPKESYSYDSFGRLSQRAVNSDAFYLFDFKYSSKTGLLDTLTYPASTGGYSLKLQYGYQNGLLNQIADYNSKTVFWNATAMNPRFQVTQETLGNGIVTSNGIDAVTGQLSTSQSGVGGGNAVQNEAYQYDRVGNLTQRQNLAANLTETFAYDNLYRLDYSRLNGTTNLDLGYNALGNITQRCEPNCGSTWTYHANKKHAVTQASVGSVAYSYTYDNNGNAISRNGNSITWSRYNYPTLINGPGESVSLEYDANSQRWRQTVTQGGATETTIYVGGLLEKVTAGGGTDWRHSIIANGKTVALVSRTSAGVNTTRYVLEDHQGSIAKVTSSSGGVAVSESFTAFGARRNPSTWSGAPNSGDLSAINNISREGYTGHTALGNMGLNHMNGRVQDALTARFLSADPYISEPGNTQAYNRYSYVNNNPLTFVDPTGFTSDSICGDIYPDGTESTTAFHTCDAESPSLSYGVSPATLKYIGQQIKDKFDDRVDKLGDRIEHLGHKFKHALGGIGSGHDRLPPEAQAIPGIGASGERSAGTIYLTGHRVFQIGPYHTAVEYTDETGPHIISAGPQGGLLVSGQDGQRPTDLPALNVTVGEIHPPFGVSTNVYFSSLRQADSNYCDCLDYDLFPGVMNSYNSNSYVSGLIQSTGGNSDGSIDIYFGGPKPVPPQYFQVP